MIFRPQVQNETKPVKGEAFVLLSPMVEALRFFYTLSIKFLLTNLNRHGTILHVSKV